MNQKAIVCKNFKSVLKLRKISDEEIHRWTQTNQCSVAMPKTLDDIADSTNQTEQDETNSIFLKTPTIFNETESIANVVTNKTTQNTDENHVPAKVDKEFKETQQVEIHERKVHSITEIKMSFKDSCR